LPGDHRELEPPDPLPNSVVKWFIADGSVGFPHVRVGHRQASKQTTPSTMCWGFFVFIYCCSHMGNKQARLRVTNHVIVGFKRKG
jgi:hypothetical protein